MKKLLFFLVSAVVLNNEYLNTQPPCGVFNDVTGSPLGAGSGPGSFAFSPLIGTDLFAAVINEDDDTIDSYSVNTSTGALTQIVSPIPTVSAPSSIYFSSLVPPSNTLFAAVGSFNIGSPSINIYTVSSGAFTLAKSNSVSNAVGWAVFSPLTSSNALYLVALISDGINAHIVVFSVATSGVNIGTLTPVAASTMGSEFSPSQIAVSPLIGSSVFYIATCNANNTQVNVYSFDASSNTLASVSGSPFTAGTGVRAVAFSPIVSGKLFAAAVNIIDHTISTYTVNPSTGAFKPILPVVAAGNEPISIAFSPEADSNLYAAVVNEQGDTCFEYSVDTSTGVFTRVGTASTGLHPVQIVYSPLIPPNLLYAGVPNNGSDNVSTYSVDLGPIAIGAFFLNVSSGQPFSATVTAFPNNSNYTSITGFTLVTPPSNGSLAFQTSNGNFTYTSNTDFSGNDSFTFTATDTNGCISATAQVVLFVAPSATISPAIQIVCPNIPIRFTALANGTGPFTYAWQGPNGFSENTGNNPNLSIPNPTIANAGNYTVTVTDVNDETGTSPDVEVVVKSIIC